MANVCAGIRQAESLRVEAFILSADICQPSALPSQRLTNALQPVDADKSSQSDDLSMAKQWPNNSCEMRWAQDPALKTFFDTV